MEGLKSGQIISSFIIPITGTVNLRVITENTLNCKAMRTKTTHVPLGSCIIFRGDLLHSGGSYIIENIRLHGMLTYDGVELTKDTVEFVKEVFKCKYCLKSFSGNDNCRSHEYYYADKSEYRSRMDRRNKRRKLKIECPVCNPNKLISVGALSRHLSEKHPGYKKT